VSGEGANESNLLQLSRPGYLTDMSASSPGSRIVLVTGASSGIGRESALAFARLGDTVVGVARHEPALRELAAEHPGIHVETCDVTDAQARVELVGRVLLRHGRIDVLVNNAGVGPVGYLHELTGDDVERVYGTNIVAVADLTRLVLPDMRGRGDGAIVMLSSVAAWASIPPVTAYASSKFALDGLIEGLRRETWGTGVLVHSINPAPISTDYLARSAGRSPQPGDPPRPASPGFPPSWVADAVLAAAASGRPVTRSVPRVAGLVRLAQVPLVGAVLDQVFGRFGGLVTNRVRALVKEQARGASSTRG
jgi:NAD(P)-dependent dehydrogenase (short-subunit alcohol dehydrogenase family)